MPRAWRMFGAAALVCAGCSARAVGRSTLPLVHGCPQRPDAATSSRSSPAAAPIAPYDDFNVVERYGAMHPNEFGGVEFDGPDVKVAFTDHLAQHGAELQRLVPRPAQLEVVRTGHTQQQLDTINAEILAVMGNGQILSAGEGFGMETIQVAPGREDLASRYATRWGDAVAITVGYLPYVPKGCGPPPPPERCPALNGGDPTTAGLRLTLDAGPRSISRYESGEGSLAVRNVARSRFLMDVGQPLLAVIVARGTTTPVGEFVGGIGGAGQSVSLAPGEEDRVNVMFGAGRCDGGAGTALPPGRYDLRVILKSEALGDNRAWLSPPAAITVSSAPPPPVRDPPILAPSPPTIPGTLPSHIAPQP